MNFDSPGHPNLYAVDHDFKETRGGTGLGSKLHIIRSIRYAAYQILFQLHVRVIAAVVYFNAVFPRCILLYRQTKDRLS